MYKCRECGAVFSDPHTWYDDPSPSGVSLTSGAYEYQECPECGSGDFDQANECASCGDYIFDGTLCEDCQLALEEELQNLAVSFGITIDELQEGICEVYKW